MNDGCVKSGDEERKSIGLGMCMDWVLREWIVPNAWMKVLTKVYSDGSAILKGWGIMKGCQWESR